MKNLSTWDYYLVTDTPFQGIDPICKNCKGLAVNGVFQSFSLEKSL